MFKLFNKAKINQRVSEKEKEKKADLVLIMPLFFGSCDELKIWQIQLLNILDV